MVVLEAVVVELATSSSVPAEVVVVEVSSPESDVVEEVT